MDDLQEKVEYCLNCQNKPCVSGCPLGNNIPEFIKLVKEQKYEEAYDILSKTTVMPFICGKICPKSAQCQGKCTRGIKQTPVLIGEIENTIGELAINNKWNLKLHASRQNGKEVAIVGAGPAGITAAINLAQKGFEITVYEKREKIGGILRYGIPDFRLDKKYIDALEEQLISLNVRIVLNRTLGENINIEELIRKYDAVLLCIGANSSCKMGIPGENMEHVLGANELLEYNKHPNYNGKKVIVIGGGNVAMDASREINHLGAKKVTVVYRRQREQMPAEPKEIEEAEAEGINFLFKTNVKEIKKDKAICTKNELIKKEGENRLSPVEIANSEFEMDADYVIMAIGSKLNSKGLDGVNLTPKGYINVDENYKTNINNVYACGDTAGGIATVAFASKTGREAANKIAESLNIS
ncbi:MAG: FAD-dependent oxidoreductase [Clostridia bacterium]|nr:FAD-dependent oxidoreductase [Clostridia bacterium]